MRFCTFEINTVLGPIRRIGIETFRGKILDLNFAYTLTLAVRDAHPRARELADVLVPADMLSFLQNETYGLKAVNEALAYLEDKIDDDNLRGTKGERLVHSREDIRLLAPLPRPATIRDTLSFLGHLKNSMGGGQIPQVYYEIPAIYYKGNPASVQGPDTDIIWPSYTERLDYELEFAAVIGRTGVNISPERAWDFIAGYMIFNDVSARDIQNKEMQGMLGPTKGKDMDGGNVFGPFLVTPDEFDPRKGHTMVARINGEEWSRGVTSDMNHDFAAIISYISQSETLHPGDVIGSGTVPTGCGIELNRFVQPGDVIELEVDGLGVLRNRFVK
ncbi:MAG: fumarylacetoacetate hydrolase family protein [Thermodesulfobacteriota bacterium]|nr:fumarylacetoacetate hydrolase family protein [Thermodesulfobacteriota bacterium]